MSEDTPAVARSLNPDRKPSAERAKTLARSRKAAAAAKVRREMIADAEGFVPAPPTLGRMFQATPAQRLMVCALVSCDIPHAAIAAHLRINDKTLSKYFGTELRGGGDRFEAALTATIAAKALQGSLPALTFLLKSKFGWRENPRVNGNGSITIDQLTDDAQAQIITDLRASIVAAAAGNSASRKEQAALVALTGAADASD